MKQYQFLQERGRSEPKSAPSTILIHSTSNWQIQCLKSVSSESSRTPLGFIPSRSVMLFMGSDTLVVYYYCEKLASLLVHTTIDEREFYIIL